jgi:hypothetical protein
MATLSAVPEEVTFVVIGPAQSRGINHTRTLRRADKLKGAGALFSRERFLVFPTFTWMDHRVFRAPHWRSPVMSRSSASRQRRELRAPAATSND